MPYATHLTIAGAASIQLQAGALVQMTQLTHQLPRQALVR